MRARENRNRLKKVKRGISKIQRNWANNYLNTIIIYYFTKSILRAAKQIIAASISNRLN